jgi:hypothetical protein
MMGWLIVKSVDGGDQQIKIDGGEDGWSVLQLRLPTGVFSLPPFHVTVISVHLGTWTASSSPTALMHLETEIQ